ncbi:hypothetical protein K488DRAFT_71521 [Vararia minispora EC-137]|uniref:Uncharacterized protein n=1 Tax=Vararia minispora EC-137 TaxID=1314806 RepID=A0ACB8QJ21_9AGAM|nr:hypothetical protein K488DRAFT_71521 [Vararia minispora EC-137]
MCCANSVAFRFISALLVRANVATTCIPQDAVNPLQEPFSAPSASTLSAPSVSASSVQPGPKDLWSEVEALGHKLSSWAEAELAKAQKIASSGIDAFMQHADNVAATAKRLSTYIAQGDQQAVHDELVRTLEDTLEKMRAMIPPPDDAPDHEARREAVRRALELAAEKIVEVLRTHTGSTRRRCSAMSGRCDLVEQHPELVKIIAVVGGSLLGSVIPDWFVLRPLLHLFGFGHIGPVKGSPAAWAQRQFWGAGVAKGSWFAALQRAGMVEIGQLPRVIGAGLGAHIAAEHLAEHWRKSRGKQVAAKAKL